MKRIPFWDGAVKDTQAGRPLERIAYAPEPRWVRRRDGARREYRTRALQSAERGDLGRIALAVLALVKEDLAAGGSRRSQAEQFVADDDSFGLWCAAASLPPQKVRAALLRQESPKSGERTEDDDWD